MCDKGLKVAPCLYRHRLLRPSETAAGRRLASAAFRHRLRRLASALAAVVVVSPAAAGAGPVARVPYHARARHHFVHVLAARLFLPALLMHPCHSQPEPRRIVAASLSAPWQEVSLSLAAALAVEAPAPGREPLY